MKRFQRDLAKALEAEHAEKLGNLGRGIAKGDAPVCTYDYWVGYLRALSVAQEILEETAKKRSLGD
jgi:hypothetical protein